MSAAPWALLAPSALGALWGAYAVHQTLRCVPMLVAWPMVEPASWPKVSLIVPARDEATHLEAAVRSRLDDDYPNLEVVLVDDRSTDGTGALVDALAAADARVKAVHITALPDGWLGKLYAMQQGVEAATGEWLLFSDADVLFAPSTLRRAVAWAEAGPYDHIAVLPDFFVRSVPLDTLIDTFGRMLIVGGRLWRVADMGSRAAVGGGLFNLVRAGALAKTPGLAWLKLEVADDVALAQMLKDHGARPSILNARGLVGLGFYDSVWQFAVGLEKTGFSVLGRYRVSVLLAVCTVGLWVEWGAVLALALGEGLVRAVALGVVVLALGSWARLGRWAGRPVWTVPLQPLAMVAFVAMALRAMVLVFVRGGVAWRGTVYPLAALRAGSRLRLW